MADEFARRQARKRILDDAVRAYLEQRKVDGDSPDDTMVTGWTLGLAVTHVASEDETDGLLIDSSPGINNFMARGIADSAAECFQAQIYGSDEVE